MNDVPVTSWWQRNWKWFVPVGCFTFLLIMAGGLMLMLTLVFSLMKEADVYGMALDRARASPEVIAALGEPIEEGWMPGGSIQINGPSGEASLSIPISGPNGGATIFLEARKSVGEWRFTTLVAEIESDGRRIDLLGAPAEVEPR